MNHQFGKTRLSGDLGLSRTVTLPINKTDQAFTMSLSGERLDSVNEFLDMDA